MPRRLLMGDIRTRAQRRCDKENDPSVITAEWNALLNEQYGELWSIVSQTGLRYFETVATFVTTGAAFVAEPSDHYETVGVNRVYADGTRGTLDEAMAQEIPDLQGLAGDAFKYSLIDDRVYLFPTPPAGQTYELLYVPQPTDISGFADSSVVDVVTPDGEAFLVWGTCVKAMHKSESDVTLAVQEREQARVRFTEEVQLRALNSSRRRVVAEMGSVWGDDYIDEADWRFNRR